MIKFLVKLPLRIVCFPLRITLKLLFWLFSGLLCLSGWIFSLISMIFAAVGVYTLFTGTVAHGVLVLVLAFLVSPFGLPMLALKLATVVDSIGDWIWEFVTDPS